MKIHKHTYNLKSRINCSSGSAVIEVAVLTAFLLLIASIALTGYARHLEGMFTGALFSTKGLIKTNRIGDPGASLGDGGGGRNAMAGSAGGNDSDGGRNSTF